ncbi:MAG: hypothetical protein EBR49_19105 [Betaproteobacteria bacterium]|nr:hypothetical protein [Betaproteobacteria bacterium]
MLTIASLIKLVAEIALMSLFGQWVLGFLAGARKDQNIFYQVLKIMTRPFVSVARLVSPRIVLDRHVPLVAFVLLVFVWVGATIYKIQTCIQIGVEHCK